MRIGSPKPDDRAAVSSAGYSYSINAGLDSTERFSSSTNVEG
jgi:hypothetical protein